MMIFVSSFKPFWHRHVRLGPYPRWIGSICARLVTELSWHTQRSEFSGGQLRSKWADRWNQSKIYHRRLIEDIRADLMLKWLYDQLPTMKIIFLMRHPCATVSSQLAMD